MKNIIEVKSVNIDDIKYPVGLTKSVKEKYLTLLITLQERNLLFVEDLPSIEAGFIILQQAEKVLSDIKTQEKLRTQELDIKTLINLDGIISKNRALYSRLINQYNQIMKEYFISPQQKIKVLKDLSPKKPDDNPITKIISKGKNDD